MPPRKKPPVEIDNLDFPFDTSKLSEDGKCIVSILAYMNKELQEKFEAKMAEKDVQIENLSKNVKELERKLEDIEEKFEDCEATTRINSIVISGDNLPPVSQGEIPVNVAQSIILNKCKLNLQPSDVVSAFRLGVKPRTQGPDRRSLLVNFSNTEAKRNVMRAVKSERPENLFFRESLTPSRNSIFYVLRRAKRQFPNIVAGCSTFDGSVFAWVKPPNAGAPGAKNGKIKINTFRKLEKFCGDTLNATIPSFVENW